MIRRHLVFFFFIITQLYWDGSARFMKNQQIWTYHIQGGCQLKYFSKFLMNFRDDSLLKLKMMFFIFIARHPKDGGRYCFHRCVYPHPARQGVVPSSWPWPGYLPIQVRSGWEGIPIETGRAPPPIQIRMGVHSSWTNTCYTVGGMPVAFTQEDFLILI